jgi:hypothetical protein
VSGKVTTRNIAAVTHSSSVSKQSRSSGKSDHTKQKASNSGGSSSSSGGVGVIGGASSSMTPISMGIPRGTATLTSSMSAVSSPNVEMSS